MKILITTDKNNYTLNIAINKVKINAPFFSVRYISTYHRFLRLFYVKMTQKIIYYENFKILTGNCKNITI